MHEELEKTLYKEERVLNKKRNEYYKEIQTLRDNSKKYDELLEKVELMRKYVSRLSELTSKAVQGVGD